MKRISTRFFLSLSLLFFGQVALAEAPPTVEATPEAPAQESAAPESSPELEIPASAHGSYEWKMSWGGGLEYGLFFTNLDRWNTHIINPASLNTFDTSFLAAHELAIEIAPVEGLRVSAFGGLMTSYGSDPGLDIFYFGLEPAFTVRRSIWEFAVGAGIGYGGVSLRLADHDGSGGSLLVRPFVEARVYPTDFMAVYARVAFVMMRVLDFEADNIQILDLDGRKTSADHLSESGPYVALGLRFGAYPDHVKNIPDTDGDTLRDDVDYCPEVAGERRFRGCPDPDADQDGLCAPWVEEMGLQGKFSCTGIDLCPEMAGSPDFHGCTNPDADQDGLCAPWVEALGLQGKFSCTGIDHCPEMAGSPDFHGCTNPDADQDGFCAPWVIDLGLEALFPCNGLDRCPDLAGAAPHGCPNPDADGDGYCKAWVYDLGLEKLYPDCKGLDHCPGEVGEDDKGCKIKRVEVTLDKIVIREMIFFELGKAKIKDESDDLINEIAQVINDNPQIKKIEIQGHTDHAGRADRNLKLSNDRAKSVYDRLLSLGVDAERLSFKGYGMTTPLIPLPADGKETPEAAAQNRRVEFVILEQEEITKIMPVTELP